MNEIKMTYMARRADGACAVYEDAIAAVNWLGKSPGDVWVKVATVTVPKPTVEWHTVTAHMTTTGGFAR